MKLGEIEHPDRRVERASRRYARSLIAGMNQRRCDGDVREQVRRYEETAVRHSFIEARVREIIDARGVTRWSALTYDNFARHVAKVLQNNGGETRRYLVKLAFDRWLRYGCEPAVLSEICRVVFDYDLEAGNDEARAKDEGQSTKDKAEGKDNGRSA